MEYSVPPSFFGQRHIHRCVEVTKGLRIICICMVPACSGATCLIGGQSMSIKTLIKYLHISGQFWSQAVCMSIYIYIDVLMHLASCIPAFLVIGFCSL